MTVVRKIAYNTIIQTAGRILTVAFGLVTIAVITRYLGREGFGQYTTAIAFVQFFSIIADLGLYLVTVNEISKPQTNVDNFLSNAFTLRFISAILFIIFSAIIVWFFPYPSIVKFGVIIASFSICFILFNQILMSLFQKHLRTDKAALAEVIGKAIFLGLTILAIYLKKDLLIILVALVCGTFIHFLLTYIFSRKYAKVSFRFDFPVWRQILKKSWPVALSTVFVLVYFKTDTLFLSILRSQEEVGIYGAPYRVLEVLITFPALFMGLIIPLLSKAYTEKNLERFQHIFQKTFDFLSMVTWPMVIGIFLLAKPIMIFIAGKEFAISAPVLQIIIVATGIIFWAHLTGYTIIALEKQRQMVKFYILAGVLAVVGYLTLIPYYSYFAAAGVTIFVEFLILVTAAVVIFKTIKMKISGLIFFKSFLASLLMGIVLHFTAAWNLFILIILGAIVYLIILYLIKGFTKETVFEIFTLKKG